MYDVIVSSLEVDAGADISRLIDVDAFLDRFGAVRWAILASPDAMVQAFIQDVRSRPYIDLARADVGMGLDQLVAKGLPGVDGALKDAVLNAPVELGEQRILKKLYFS